MHVKCHNMIYLKVNLKLDNSTLNEHGQHPSIIINPLFLVLMPCGKYIINGEYPIIIIIYSLQYNVILQMSTNLHVSPTSTE